MLSALRIILSSVVVLLLVFLSKLKSIVRLDFPVIPCKHFFYCYDIKNLIYLPILTFTVMKSIAKLICSKIPCPCKCKCDWNLTKRLKFSQIFVWTLWLCLLCGYFFLHLLRYKILLLLGHQHFYFGRYAYSLFCVSYLILLRYIPFIFAKYFFGEKRPTLHIVIDYIPLYIFLICINVSYFIVSTIPNTLQFLLTSFAVNLFGKGKHFDMIKMLCLAFLSDHEKHCWMAVVDGYANVISENLKKHSFLENVEKVNHGEESAVSHIHTGSIPSQFGKPLML